MGGESRGLDTDQVAADTIDDWLEDLVTAVVVYCLVQDDTSDTDGENCSVNFEEKCCMYPDASSINVLLLIWFLYVDKSSKLCMYFGL